jgi:hypothetical protein
MTNQVLLRQVTAEWDAKARIYLESARYWEITKLTAKEKGNIEEEKRASERYHSAMSQAKHAHDKLQQCLELRSSL